MTAREDVVQAVAEAMGDVWATRTNDEDGSTSIYARSVDDLATVAVDAAWPLIAEAIAERIEAQKHSPDMHIPTYPSGGVCVHCDRMDTAARIAREVPDA